MAETLPLALGREPSAPASGPFSFRVSSEGQAYLHVHGTTMGFTAMLSVQQLHQLAAAALAAARMAGRGAPPPSNVISIKAARRADNAGANRA